MTTASFSTLDSSRSSTNGKPSTAFSRWSALSKAEALQFMRNRLLMFMAFVFPIGMPLAMFLVMKGSDAPIEFASATAVEMFFLFAMMFVQFYAVLSMATTRRDEKVLKRLRTGELRDGEILFGISTPAAVLTIVLTLVFGVLMSVLGMPLPASVFPVIFALGFGLVISAALALLTTTFTQNAEAAQMTSMPVIALAMISQGSIRQILPENVSAFVDRTPFALMSDSAQIGWTGITTKRFTSGEGTIDSNGALAEALPTLGLLLVWSFVLMWASNKYMKWETNR